MIPLVYDAGPLIAGARDDRGFWAEHRARLAMGVLPFVPAPVVAQVSRSSRQVQLRRLLRGCEIVARSADVVTGDRRDIGRLVSRAGRKFRVIDV